MFIRRKKKFVKTFQVKDENLPYIKKVLFHYQR